MANTTTSGKGDTKAPEATKAPAGPMSTEDQLKAAMERISQLEGTVGLLADKVKQAGKQPLKKSVDIIRVDRSRLTAEQVKGITTYSITWMGPLAGDYEQPVLVETLGSQNKAVARWREAMRFSPEGLVGVKPTLVENVPLKEDENDGKPDRGGAGN